MHTQTIPGKSLRGFLRTGSSKDNLDSHHSGGGKVPASNKNLKPPRFLSSKKRSLTNMDVHNNSHSLEQFSDSVKSKAASELDAPKAALSQFKLAPPRIGKRHDESAYCSPPTRTKGPTPEALQDKRSNARVATDKIGTPSRSKTVKAPAGKKLISSSTKRPCSLQDFMSEYAKIMDDFTETEPRQDSRNKSSQSVTGW